MQSKSSVLWEESCFNRLPLQ